MKNFTVSDVVFYMSLAFAIGMLGGTAMALSLSADLEPKPDQPTYVSDVSGLSCLLYPEERKAVVRF